jgi:hypothetical protein
VLRAVVPHKTVKGTTDAARTHTLHSGAAAGREGVCELAGHHDHVIWAWRSACHRLWWSWIGTWSLALVHMAAAQVHAARTEPMQQLVDEVLACKADTDARRARADAIVCALHRRVLEKAALTAIPCSWGCWRAGCSRREHGCSGGRGRPCRPRKVRCNRRARRSMRRHPPRGPIDAQRHDGKAGNGDSRRLAVLCRMTEVMTRRTALEERLDEAESGWTELLDSANAVLQSEQQTLGMSL